MSEKKPHKSYVGRDQAKDGQYMQEQVGQIIMYDGPHYACPRLKLLSFDPTTMTGTFALESIWPLI